MNVIVGFILLLLIGFIGSRIQVLQKSFSWGMQYLFLGRLEFLFLGTVLGPYLTNVLTAEALRELTPVLNLGLGWIGLIIGLQFNRQIMRQIRRKVWFMGITISFISFAIVFCLILSISLRLLWTETGGMTEPAAIQAMVAFSFLMGWVGTISTYTTLAVIQRDAAARGEMTRLLQLLTEVRVPLAILFMGVWYSIMHLTHTWHLREGIESLEEMQSALLLELPYTVVIPVEPVMSGIWWLIISLLLGIVLGWMFHYLIGERLSDNELLLITAGCVILSSGLASYLHLSPLFLNLIMGVTLANLPSFTRNRVTSLLLSTEHPFFVVFMILVGAMWPPITWNIIQLTQVYLVGRILGLYIGARIGGKLWFHRGERPSTHLGLAMWPQGGVAIALVVDFMRIHPGALANTALGVVILSLLVNQIIGPSLMVYILRRQGEIVTSRRSPDNRASHSIVHRREET